MKFTAIRENHLFVKAYAGGKRAPAKTCSVYVLKDRKARQIKKSRPDKQYINRIGITASKKIGGAVQRNRAKRVIREALRLIMQEHTLKTGHLIVIAAREKATVCKMQDVKRDLQYAMSKLDMYFVPKSDAPMNPAPDQKQP